MKYYYTYDKDAEPFITIKSGGSVSFETEDAFRGLVKKEEECTEENINSIIELNCPVTGPIVIEEAEPGNWLEVIINDIQCGEYGASIIGGHFSAIGDRFKDNKAKVVPIKDGIISFSDKIKFPVRPMIGTIGVASPIEKPLSCLQGRYGGNMDCPTTGIGNKLYLPVMIRGGFLFAGDVHAIQGDGEMINPFETPSKINLTINVLKEKSSKGKWPRIKTKATIETITCDRTFYNAAQIAMSQMVDWLVEDYEFSFEEASFLCGQLVDARPCQLVNSYHSARCVLENKYLPSS